jgi:hypothetical protein
VTTVLEVISDALFEIDQIAIGASPSAEEADFGLNVFQSMLDHWVNQGTFGQLNDYIASGAYTAKEQDRILNDGYTISLPTSVVDLLTGLTRPPLDLSIVQVLTAGSSPETSIYDAQTAQWVRLDGLALTDTAPLANRGRHGLASALAIPMAGNRATISPATVGASTHFRAALSTKRASAPRNAISDYF